MLVKLIKIIKNIKFPKVTPRHYSCIKWCKLTIALASKYKGLIDKERVSGYQIMLYGARKLFMIVQRMAYHFASALCSQDNNYKLTWSQFRT